MVLRDTKMFDDENFTDVRRKLYIRPSVSTHYLSVLAQKEFLIKFQTNVIYSKLRYFSFTRNINE